MGRCFLFSSGMEDSSHNRAVLNIAQLIAVVMLLAAEEKWIDDTSMHVKRYRHRKNHQNKTPTTPNSSVQTDNSDILALGIGNSNI